MAESDLYALYFSHASNSKEMFARPKIKRLAIFKFQIGRVSGSRTLCVALEMLEITMNAFA